MTWWKSETYAPPYLIRIQVIRRLVTIFTHRLFIKQVKAKMKVWSCEWVFRCRATAGCSACAIPEHLVLCPGWKLLLFYQGRVNCVTFFLHKAHPTSPALFLDREGLFSSSKMKTTLFFIFGSFLLRPFIRKFSKVVLQETLTRGKKPNQEEKREI